EAANQVPFYRDTWSREEKQAATAGELSALPLLTKEPLRADPIQFVNPELRPRRPMVLHTSGSSGTPIASYWSIDELRESMAVREARSAEWAGTSFKYPRSTFSGRMVEPDPNSTGPFYRFNAIERQIYLSPFHLSAATAPKYVEAFRRHKIQWATGYAVSYALLAGFILSEGIEPLKLRSVITTSEKLTDPMREKISAAFGCQVFEEYSSVENVSFASECEHGSLHVSPDVGVVEILRPDGTPTSPGEVGEVVVTGLYRRVQPLIRFRIGDYATWGDGNCACGRAMPVIAEVQGRTEDVVTGADGRQLVRFHGIFVDLPGVVEAQVIQETLTQFRILVVPDSRFGPETVADIQARMVQRLGDVSVEVEQVEQVPRTKAGKYQAVISHVK
ncbi:MAG: phenylacetate--CoA ligase family protein, partial [Acidimicrobiales bacterium]|nr:phenylacetate--CoA ligase family protein [Acidimicrobiales bacterium]